MEFSLRLELPNHKVPHLLWKAKVPLPCSQEAATKLNPEPDESS
jgi:hypothetical protein